MTNTTAKPTAPAHVCDRRTDAAGTVYHVERAACPACMAELEAEAIEHDRRVIAAGGPVYPSGARNAEANYVDTTRGR